MEYIVPLDSFDDVLKEAINLKLKELQACEKIIPAIFIVHNLQNDTVVYMSERGLNILGTTLEKIQLSNREYHQLYFNAEDVPIYLPKIFSLIQRNDTTEMVTFFQQV